jgi:tetraacyldisaccharide 4'-kinase
MLISPERLQKIWYGHAPAPWWLRAGAWLYACLRLFAQLPYSLRLRRAQTLDVPVVVVGNLTVGGTGKTPLTIALVEALRARGIAVGVISRGYGRSTQGLRLVDQTSTAAEVGDEPLLIARRTRAPVAVGEDRVAAARRLLGAVPLDLLISDDGLEHLALPRRLEIVVIDGARGFGNGRLLPAGPLRAPLSRLQRADMLVRNGGEAGPGEYAMQIAVRGIRRQKGGHVEALDSWRGRRAHVVAGTGNPARVFASARAIGIEVIEHPQPDHVDYAAAGIPKFDDGLPCITTEKDAVKLPALEGWYVLEIGAKVDVAVIDRVVASVEGSR